MTLKKGTSLAMIALAVLVWMGCSSKEDKAKYDEYYGSGSKARVEASLVNIQNAKKTKSISKEEVSNSDAKVDGAKSDEAAPSVEAKPQRKPVPAEVSALLNKHACFACHQAYDKVIGPAYADVAKKKYSVDEIVELVHSPKPEHWPGFPPMAPMTHVPKGDIAVIASWINSL